MQKRLIKYLEENFNAKIMNTSTLLVFLQSDLHLVDLPTVIEAFNGDLHINFIGDGLVDDDNRLWLCIQYDHTPFDSSNKSEMTIHTNIFSKESYAQQIN